ncbi:hypothetical protein MRBLRH13_000228 [Agrobacterium radiobacter]|uniref:hypothetical protein n=1 Tax=Agrobacterium radiobacter TaxID=362 RepID=UPI00343ECC04
MTHQEYDAYEAQGKQAQARVGSVVRGGFVSGDEFFFVSTRLERVPLSSVRDLEYAPYAKN